MFGTRVDEATYSLVFNPWFDRVIVATILVNCLFLALYDPTMSEEQADYIVVGDYIFSAVFIIELILKWNALSVSTYFRDKWNWVDAVVVIESVVSLILKAANNNNGIDISALRALRVLRPLRAVTYIPQVKLLFETVISALVVVNTLLLCIIFALLFFGNVGFTFWSGSLRYTCLDTVALTMLDEGLVCGAGYSCPDGYECLDRGYLVGANSTSDPIALNAGVTGFYDFYHSMLQAFQVVSLEGWQVVMWHTQDAAGSTTSLYFLVLMVVGYVFLVAMFPAVVSTKLQVAIEKQLERERQETRMKNRAVVNGEREVKGEPSVSMSKHISEFELILNDYSKIEAEEIKVFHHIEALRRGHIKEQAIEEPKLPRLTPFPHNPAFNRARRVVLEEMGPFAKTIYGVIFLNALVLCLHTNAGSETKGDILSKV
ncbi:unnamed protein product [Choristocarpus tenellus]